VDTRQTGPPVTRFSSVGEGVLSSGELLVAYRVSDLLDYEEIHTVSLA